MIYWHTKLITNYTGKITINKKLEFLIPNIPIESNFDFKKIKQELLRMTPDKRKQLGINKSTLWYLKKGLESGKKPRIYKKVLEKVELARCNAWIFQLWLGFSNLKKSKILGFRLGFKPKSQPSFKPKLESLTQIKVSNPTSECKFEFSLNKDL